MSKQINLDALNMHLFETIEMLKNNSDPNASDNEKIDVDTAKTIADLAKVVVDGYKVKAQVLAIVSKSENPELTKGFISQNGMLEIGNENEK
jgi:hypothetical protein